GLETPRRMTVLREPVRERHAEAACVRRREQLLGRRAARSALGAGLPAQGGITERPAASAGLALTRHQIAFPLRRCPALHGRSSCCRRLVADVGATGNGFSAAGACLNVSSGTCSGDPWSPDPSPIRPTRGSLR